MKRHRHATSARPVPELNSEQGGAAGRPGAAEWEHSATLLWLGLVVLVYVIDFLLDVRHRDALCWMDPYQYYNFALDLLERVRTYSQFELPSVFPFFILPFLKVHSSLPSGLCVNLLFLLIMVAATLVLCRHLRLRAHSAIVACAVLSAPLLIGLSRSLYVEFALSAIVAVQYAVWLGRPELDRARDLVAFALVFALGLLMKMTYPLFIIVPALAIAGLDLRAGRRRAAARLLLALCLPALVVVAAQYFIFSKSFSYYLSLGNTQIPIMYLIGPAERFSAGSIFYYPVQTARNLLYLLTPLVLVLIVIAARRPHGRESHASSGRGPRIPRMDRDALILWTWSLTPGLLLIPQVVKEPRHIAPCVLPAVLLLFRGISRIDARGLRVGLTAVALAVACGQYLVCTLHARVTPYFLDRRSYVAELEQAMGENDQRLGLQVGSAGTPVHLRWLYTRNIALSGCDPNMALALTWAFAPAVCYDVDLIPADGSSKGSLAYQSFEDLYFLAGFNTYNRRCQYARYDYTLGREAVVANAAYVIVAGESEGRLAALWPEHRRVASLGEGRERIHLLARREGDGTSYRRLYAQEFLRQADPAKHGDAAPAYFDMTMDALLRGDRRALQEVLAMAPPEQLANHGIRNIYWTGKMLQLRSMAQSLWNDYARSSAGDRGVTPGR
jgi:hypothetical protein